MWEQTKIYSFSIEFQNKALMFKRVIVYLLHIIEVYHGNQRKTTYIYSRLLFLQSYKIWTLNDSFGHGGYHHPGGEK